MARAATRRNSAEQIDIAPDAFEEVMDNDRQSTADDLAAALDAFNAVTGSNVKATVFRIPKGVGKWEWCLEIQPPVDTGELMGVLKNEFGPGDYAMRVWADGRVRTTKHFSIAVTKTLGQAPPRNDNNEILPLLIQQMQASKTDTMQMMTMMMQQSSASSDRQMQMMMGMMTAMMGGKDKTSEVMAALAPFMHRDAPANTMKDTIETLAAVKGLLGNGDAGSSDDGIMGLVKSAAPMIGDAFKGLGDFAAAKRAEAEQRHIITTQPAGYVAPLSEPGRILGPAPAPMVPQPEAPMLGMPPVLALIKDDILFMFRRGYDPQLAADALFDILNKNGVKFEDVQPIIEGLPQAGPEQWVPFLASFGIDLSSNIVWAQSVLENLVGCYTENGADDTDSDGESGGEADA